MKKVITLIVVALLYFGFYWFAPAITGESRSQCDNAIPLMLIGYCANSLFIATFPAD